VVVRVDDGVSILDAIAMGFLAVAQASFYERFFRAFTGSPVANDLVSLTKISAGGDDDLALAGAPLPRARISPLQRARISGILCWRSARQ
jgi:hypothetical protein